MPAAPGAAGRRSGLNAHLLAHSVSWVNPLKSAPGYQPLARGMAAALPYVDVFLSGHNFESLQELSYAVAGASGRGGAR